MKWLFLALPALAVPQGNVALDRSFTIGGVDLLRYEGMRKAIGLSKEQDAKIVAEFHKMQRYLDSVYEEPSFFKELRHRRPDPSESLIMREWSKKVEAGNAKRKRWDAEIFKIPTPSQKARLRELHMQWTGPAIVHQVDLARLLGLSAKQVDEIQQISGRRLAEELRQDFSLSYQYWVWSAIHWPHWNKQYDAVMTAEQIAKFKKLRGKPLDRFSLMTNRITLTSTR